MASQQQHAPVAAAPVGAKRGGTFAPLRYPVFRALWVAQLTSNVGTWMQTVAAQWLMLSIDGRPQMVALVTAATSLPALLVGLPAGALGDVLDRRRLLICSQSFMLVAAATLAIVTLTGAITPWTLLGLTFAIGLGQGLTGPSWQAIQPELVKREEIPQAAALGSMSMNIGRAAGPAFGGLLVAATSPGWAFMVNAVSFLGVLGVLVWWRREAPARALGAEPVFSAVRSGLRYARSARRLRAILVRSAVFISFASAFWALLPVRAHALGLGATGYGLLLTAVGAGAVGGAFVSGWARRRLGIDGLLAISTVTFAAGTAVLAFVDSQPARVRRRVRARHGLDPGRGNPELERPGGAAGLGASPWHGCVPGRVPGRPGARRGALGPAGQPDRDG